LLSDDYFNVLPNSERELHVRRFALFNMSTAVDGPSPKAPLTFSPPKAPPEDWQLHGEVNEQHWKDIWTMLIVIRVVNAVTLGTFFQPDEFFQALEPAWALAFGSRSGAWLTWVCKYR